MNVRWKAVLTGVAADLLISSLVFLIADPYSKVATALATAPDLANPQHLFLIGIGLFITGIGGYVAGRMAQTAPALNGLMVGVVDILISQFGPIPPRTLVIASAIGCLASALGGLVSRFLPPQHSSMSKDG